MADTSRFPQGTVLRGVNIATTATPLNTIVESGGALYRSTNAAAPAYVGIDLVGSNLRIGDSDVLSFGDAPDVTMTPDGTDVIVASASGGRLYVEDQAFDLTDGSDTTTRATFSIVPGASALVTQEIPNVTGDLVGSILGIVAPQTLVGATVGAAEAAFGAAGSVIALGPATLRDGAVIRFRAFATLLDAAGVSAVTFRVRLGGLAGILLAESAAVDGATNDIYMIDGVATIRTDGAAGTIVSQAITTTGTPGGTTNLEPYVLQSTAIDTTGALTLNCTAEFGANNSDLRLDSFVVDYTVAK